MLTLVFIASEYYNILTFSSEGWFTLSGGIGRGGGGKESGLTAVPDTALRTAAMRTCVGSDE